MLKLLTYQLDLKCINIYITIDFQALCDALEEKSNQDCIRKFLSDPQVPALYVQRSSTKGKFQKLIFLVGDSNAHQAMCHTYSVGSLTMKNIDENIVNGFR